MSKFNFSKNTCWKCRDTVVHFSGDRCTECGSPARRPVAHVLLGLFLVCGFITTLPLMAAVCIGEDHPIYKPTGIYAEKVKPTPKQDESKLDLDPIKKPVVMPVRVDFSAYPQWFGIINGVRYHTSASHLINDHGAELLNLGLGLNDLKSMSQEQINRLHGKLHGELPQVSRSTATTTTTNTLPTVKAPATPSVAPSGYVRGNCPGGFCPAPQPSYYRRGRR